MPGPENRGSWGKQSVSKAKGTAFPHPRSAGNSSCERRRADGKAWTRDEQTD